MKIIGIPGSLRRASINRKLLHVMSGLAPPGVTIEVHDLLDVPPFNEDVEAEGVPPAVQVLRDAVAGAQGVLIATPEYNAGVPGVLKNGLDWLSRPPRKSVLDGKPIGIVGASPGILGTARAQPQLRQMFVFTNSPVMMQPEIFVTSASQKFDELGKLTDERTRAALVRYLVALKIWVERFSG
jgi:chromate reductase